MGEKNWGRGSCSRSTATATTLVQVRIQRGVLGVKWSSPLISCPNVIRRYIDALLIACSHLIMVSFSAISGISVYQLVFIGEKQTVKVIVSTHNPSCRQHTCGGVISGHGQNPMYVHFACTYILTSFCIPPSKIPVSAPAGVLCRTPHCGADIKSASLTIGSLGTLGLASFFKTSWCTMYGAKPQFKCTE